METAEVKEYYNKTLKGDPRPYEYSRWFASDQAKAGYDFTKEAIERDVLPKLKHGMHVMELGPGPGTWSKVLISHVQDLKMHLVDISEEMLQQAKEALSSYSNFEFTVSDILQFKTSNKYDFFFSSRAIEYVPQKKEAIENIVNALKAGGSGYIITKMPHYSRSRLLGKKITSFHSTQISPREFKTLLEESGCLVENIRPVTIVFPKMQNGTLDRTLHMLVKNLPLALVMPVCESYAVSFQKK